LEQFQEIFDTFDILFLLLVWQQAQELFHKPAQSYFSNPNSVILAIKFSYYLFIMVSVALLHISDLTFWNIIVTTNTATFWLSKNTYWKLIDPLIFLLFYINCDYFLIRLITNSSLLTRYLSNGWPDWTTVCQGQLSFVIIHDDPGRTSYSLERSTLACPLQYL